MICSNCHRERAITLTHRQRIRGQVVEWTECVGCFLAIERKEQAVQPTPAAPGKRKRTESMPFEMQLETRSKP
jgi:hypothetical protein